MGFFVCAIPPNGGGGDFYGCDPGAKRRWGGVVARFVLTEVGTVYAAAARAQSGRGAFPPKGGGNRVHGCGPAPKLGGWGALFP